MGAIAVYTRLLLRATVVRDEGGYELNAGQANPVLFEEFLGEMLDAGFPPVMWEPFAGPNGTPAVMELCADIGVKLISYSVRSESDDVIEADSTVVGPSMTIGGMFIHPPYFGCNPFSEKEGELSRARDEASYRAALSRTFSLGLRAMPKGGMVCVVGRRYRCSVEIRLDEWIVEDLVEVGFTLCGVMMSEPDVAIMGKVKR
jgi:hypothetical protein